MSAIVYMLAGMGVAAAVGVVINRKKQAAEADRRRAQQRAETVTSAAATNDITRVGRGGVFALPPFGPNRGGFETYVTRKHRYQTTDGKHSWYELECNQKGRDLLVEWHRSRGRLNVTAGYDDQNPSLDDLGLTEEDLIRFDESGSGTFQWDGQTWRYKDSGEDHFFEDDGREREGYYGWDFATADEKRFLSVSKWEGDADFEVHHLWAVDADAIEVFDGGRT